MGITIFRPSQRLVIPSPGVQVWTPSVSAGGSFTGVLDGVSNVAAAYSLRRLSSAYSGSAVRVRRSSDSTEQDIGFDGSGEFDIVAFSAFVGGGTGYVKTWYDQSGKGNNGSQTANGQQPSIALSAINSKATLLFDGVNDFIDLPDTAIVFNPFSCLVACRFNTLAGMILGNVAGSNQRIYVPYAVASNQFRYYYGGTSFAGGGAANTEWNIHSFKYAASPGTIFAWINGTAQASGSDTIAIGSPSALNIGSYAQSSEFVNGYVADVILLQSSISTADHNAIGTNMATRYGLSWTAVT